MKKTLTIILTVCAFMAFTLSAQGQPLVKTHVETGDIEGILDGPLAVYKAIPYAAPPVGNLRWKAPQPPKAWEGVLKTDNFGPMPPQPTRPGRTADMMNEDCLYLGIATPAKTAAEKLPVMVWIHGGGFQTEWYGGDLWKHLAMRGVVIVSVEYRTGALGFMAHPELTKEDPEGHSGNYGLLDQIFALKWVQRNIANFGGDPSNVTIFGESAGAISCSMLCASPLAKGLFHRCISQSGGSFAPWTDQPRTLGMDASQKGAEQQGLAFQKHLKKKSLKELRKMDAMALCDGNVGFAGFWPCVDGYVIKDDQYRLYERGDYNDVPVIVMTNSDEGALFAPGNITAESYQKTIQGIFGNWADEALKTYPGNTDDEAWHGFGDAFRDMGFAWPSYAWVNLQSRTGKSPAYAAYLAQPSKMSFSQDPRRRGVAHADDILYLNGHFLTQPDKFPAEAATAEILQQYWTNFAKTGNPNGKGLPYWPSFDDRKATTMQFSNGASLITRPNREQVDFVDRFYRAKREETEGARKGLEPRPFKGVHPSDYVTLDAQKIQNPMLWADVPDPDVIRVGDTFYLVSTTMHLMPGAPIMKSKDLKNWETVGYVFDKLTDSPKYDLQQGTAYGRGQWATSLKYHNGKFYALLAPNEDGAMGDTYIFSAEKAEGPWSIVSRMRHFHDCTLFFDDDNRVYVVYGTGELMELKPDLSDVIEGTYQKIFEREDDEQGLLEGSRMIKHNGKYYLLMISHTYAPGHHRREVCYRADDIHGPYEKQVILESEFGGFSYEAQGTIVDTEDGDWYGIIFQDRGGVGRVLTVMPCRWINGWPMLGDENGKVPDQVRPLKAGEPATAIVKADDFSEPKLGLHWQWNHNPIDAAWSLTERPGFLRLKTSRVVNSIYLAPNTLTQRMEGPTCTGSIEMDLSQMKDGDRAGLAAFNSDTGALTIKKENGKLVLEMNELKVKLSPKDKEVTNVEEKTIESVNLEQDKIWLRIDADFRPAKGQGFMPGTDLAKFYYSLDGKQWTKIGSDYRMSFDWQRFFMGQKFGLFNFATKEAGGYVDIDAFTYKKK